MGLRLPQSALARFAALGDGDGAAVANRSGDVAARRTKYGAKRTTVDGVTFDSAKEARVWGELCLEQRAGLIRNLRRQVPFELVVNGVKVCRFIADMVFERNGKEVVVDVKSAATRRIERYRLKRKLMKACHGIEIIEM